MSFPHCVELSNGVKQPLIGLGTWYNDNREELKRTLEVALDAGYRYEFCHILHHNCWCSDTSTLRGIMETRLLLEKYSKEYLKKAN